MSLIDRLNLSTGLEALDIIRTGDLTIRTLLIG